MTFKIHCPNCQKVYTAEPRWAGKRTQCKKCQTEFVVKPPSESAPAPVEPVVPVPTPHAPEAIGQHDVLHDLADLGAQPRAREYPASPARVAIESRLRYLLILLALGLAVLGTVRGHDIVPWPIALLRVGTLFLLFLLLILPLSYQSVAASFRRHRKKLLADSLARVAATFSLPAAAAFAAWQIRKTPAALAVGLIALLPMMFEGFRFQMRLRFFETIGTYVRACVWFLLGAALSTVLVVGVNFIINRALLNAHAVSYVYSPLDDALPWQTPTAPPGPGVDVAVGTRPSATKPSPHPASSLPAALFDAGDLAPNVNSSRGPITRGHGSLFVNPDDDQFLADLEKNGQPWIRQISRPDGQSPFDFIVSPGAAAPYVGFVSFDPRAPTIRRFAAGMSIDSRIRRAAAFDIADDANPHTFPRDYLLSADGTLLLHLKSLVVELISTATHRKDTFSLTAPDRASKDQLSPQLVGLSRDQGLTVRWSNSHASTQVVQRYSYASRSLVETCEIPDALLAAESSAVSTNPTGPIALASIVIPLHEPLSLCLLQFGDKLGRTTRTPVPSTIGDLSDYENIELAFSPDGGQIAALLNDRTEALVYVWKSKDLSATPLKASPPMLAPALASSHVVGPRLRWIDDQALLVDGMAVISTVAEHPGIIGMLSETPAIGATSIRLDQILLSYLGADGLCHLAEVEFDPRALHEATPVKP